MAVFFAIARLASSGIFFALFSGEPLGRAGAQSHKEGSRARIVELPNQAAQLLFSGKKGKKAIICAS